MTETITLDPSGAIANRTAIDITAYVASPDGIDWGDAAIQSYMADQAVGSAPVDYRIPNRTIKIPLHLRKLGATDFATIRTNLQQKVARWHQEGGAIGRTAGGTALYADVVDATLHLSGSLWQAYRDFDVDAWLECVCVPDFYGDEVTLSDHVETTNPHLIFTEVTVNGNYPGRVRLIVDNDQATDQHGLLWGFRCKNYDSASSAALFFEAEAMTFINGTVQSNTAGSSGTHAASLSNAPLGVWVSMLSLTLSSGPTPLTHTGTYRVWARCLSGDSSNRFRLQWGNGSLATPVTNDPVAIPGASAFYLLDLGVVRLDKPAVGSQQWFGVIQTYVNVASIASIVDCIWLQPLDEGAGKLTYNPVSPPSSISTGGKPPATVVDDATVGSVSWDNATNAQFLDNNVAQSHAALSPGTTTHYLKATNFFGTLPSSATITGIQVGVYWQLVGNPNESHSWTTHLVKAGTIQAGTPSASNRISVGALTLETFGGPTDLWGGTWLYSDLNSGTFGCVAAFTLSADDQGSSFLGVDAITVTAYYTLAAGFTVAQDAVIYASSTAELRTEGMLRKGSGSTIYGPMSNVTGDLPRIPPSSLEARTVQTFLKLTRGNFANEPDAGIDDLSCQIKYRPSYLYTT